MDEDRTAGAFAQRLAALKRQGAGLLVVGATGDGSHLELSRRLLGDSKAGPRRRVLVLTDGRGGPEERIPEGERDSDHLRMVDRRPLTRGVAETSSGSAPTPLDIDAVERESLAAIDGLEAAAGGFATSELRLCLDSLRPLIDRHGTTGTEPLVRSLLDRVRVEQGLAHVHLPVPYDMDVVEEMTDPFDAVIELRPGEQRWHVLGEPLHSEWLPVDYNRRPEERV
jgi:hypothetical protein